MPVRYQAALRPEGSNYSSREFAGASSACIRVYVRLVRLHACDGGVRRCRERVHDFRDVSFADDERRREQHVVAALSVYRAAHRIAHYAARHGFALYGLVELQRRREGLLGRAIGDEFDGDEEAAAPDISDVRVIRQPGVQCAAQRQPLFQHVVEQSFLAHGTLNGERRSARDRMAEIRVTVLKKPAAVADRVEYLTRHQGRAYRLIAAAQPLGDHHHVGEYALLVVRKQRPGPAHAAHHFVEYQQHAVTVADFADTPEISRDGRHGAQGRAGNRFGDERDHTPGTRLEDGLLELVRHAHTVLLVGFPVLAV